MCCGLTEMSVSILYSSISSVSGFCLVTSPHATPATGREMGTPTPTTVWKMHMKQRITLEVWYWVIVCGETFYWWYHSDMYSVRGLET